MVSKNKLEGEVIKEVRELAQEELEEVFLFPERGPQGVKIILETGEELIPFADEEGNQPGYLFLQEKQLTEYSKIEGKR